MPPVGISRDAPCSLPGLLAAFLGLLPELLSCLTRGRTSIPEVGVCGDRGQEVSRVPQAWREAWGQETLKMHLLLVLSQLSCAPSSPLMP